MPKHFKFLPLDDDSDSLLATANAVPAPPRPAAQDGTTVLHTAAHNGHVEIARLLLERGASYTTANQASQPKIHTLHIPVLAHKTHALTRARTDSRAGALLMVATFPLFPSLPSERPIHEPP